MQMWPTCNMLDEMPIESGDQKISYLTTVVLKNDITVVTNGMCLIKFDDLVVLLFMAKRVVYA